MLSSIAARRDSSARNSVLSALQAEVYSGAAAHAARAGCAVCTLAASHTRARGSPAPARSPLVRAAAAAAAAMTSRLGSPGAGASGSRGASARRGWARSCGHGYEGGGAAGLDHGAEDAAILDEQRGASEWRGGGGVAAARRGVM